MQYPNPSGLARSVKHILAHVFITLLAVGIAFSLPNLAQYILYFWWPMVEDNSRLLLATEIVFAAALVLLFNISKVAWDSRRKLKASAIASLVHAREREGWLRPAAEKDLIKQLRGARDIAIQTVTGKELFGPGNWVTDVLAYCSEARILLMNPDGEGARERARAAKDPAAALAACREEVQASIAYLEKVAAAGKNVSLKLYDATPFWQLVVAGEYAWVRHCYRAEVGTWPEYVFHLQKNAPRRGFYTPFYVQFLTLWNDPRLLQYDFRKRELVCRTADGRHGTHFGFGPERDRHDAALVAHAAGKARSATAALHSQPAPLSRR